MTLVKYFKKMQTKYLIIIFLIALTSVICFNSINELAEAQQNPESISKNQIINSPNEKVWNNTYWGMSSTDLKILFGDTLSQIQPQDYSFKSSEPYSEYIIPEFKVGTHFYGVIFSLENEKLKRIILRNNINHTSFAELKKLLEDKYGIPNSTDDKKLAYIDSEKLIWLLPKTRISLLKAFVLGKFYIGLTYEERLIDSNI
jgi:hypothetical protein